MKLLFCSSILWYIMTTAAASAQYPRVTVRQIQEVPLDSLLLLDTLQCSSPARWTLQVSPYYGDTVTLTAVCVVPARVLDYTNYGFNLLLADTGSPAVWSGLFVRPSTPDTTLIIDWGILNVEPGDVIRFVGIVSEFPAPSCASATHIVPLLSIPLQILGTAPVPPHTPVQTADFSFGGFFPNEVHYSTGERYEFMRVLLRNVTVFSREPNNCVLGLVDSTFNVIYTYKANTSLQCPSYPVGTRLDSVRGFITSTFGSQGSRYRIAITDTNDMIVTDIEETEPTRILTYKLESNYPNPFNPSTTISFSIPTRSFVTLAILDPLGRQVSVLVSEELSEGSHARQWIAGGMSSGVYFYQLRAGGFIQTNKLLLLR